MTNSRPKARRPAKRAAKAGAAKALSRKSIQRAAAEPAKESRPKSHGDSNERSLYARVAATLGREIVAGVHPAGSILPTEPEMLARFSVSRNVLREAYSVLAAKGMIAARPKVGTRVRPVAEWNALDPEVLAWHFQAAPTEKVVEDLFTVRQMIESPAAALAASARSPATLLRLQEAYERMVKYRNGEGDLVAADLDFHMAILEGRDNPFLAALGALINTSLQAVFKYSWRGAARIQSERLIQHEVVLDAIRDGDPKKAHRLMTVLLEDSIGDIRKELRPA